MGVGGGIGPVRLTYRKISKGVVRTYEEGGGHSNVLRTRFKSAPQVIYVDAFL